MSEPMLELTPLGAKVKQFNVELERRALLNPRRVFTIRYIIDKDAKIDPATGDPIPRKEVGVKAEVFKDLMNKVFGPENWMTHPILHEGLIGCSLQLRVDDEWHGPRTQFGDLKLGDARSVFTIATQKAASEYGLMEKWYLDMVEVDDDMLKVEFFDWWENDPNPPAPDVKHVGGSRRDEQAPARREVPLPGKRPGGAEPIDRQDLYDRIYHSFDDEARDVAAEFVDSPGADEVLKGVRVILMTNAAVKHCKAKGYKHRLGHDRKLNVVAQTLLNTGDEVIDLQSLSDQALLELCQVCGG